MFSRRPRSAVFATPAIPAAAAAAITFSALCMPGIGTSAGGISCSISRPREPYRLGAGESRERPADFVVGIQDGVVAGLLRAEQIPFRRGVILEGVMPVEMILRHVQADGRRGRGRC